MVDELARRGALLASSAISCSLSYLLYPLFSFLGLEAYCLFFNTLIFSISTKDLVLPRHARCVFSLSSILQWHSLLISLGLAESRILPAAPADTRSRTPLISFCTVQLRTLCAAYFSTSVLSVSLRPLDSLFLYDLWSRP